jgi:hypothetical protein
VDLLLQIWNLFTGNKSTVQSEVFCQTDFNCKIMSDIKKSNDVFSTELSSKSLIVRESYFRTCQCKQTIIAILD